MTLIKSDFLERQLKRGMRLDARLFMRPDWRRHIRSGFENDLPFALYERKYSPDQPRVPAGNREGGQWTDAGGGGGRARPAENTGPSRTIELSAANRKRGHGHHYVASAEVRNRKISEEAAKVFKNAKSGPLLDVRSNKWDQTHIAYNRAIGEALDDYLKKAGTAPEKHDRGPGPRVSRKSI